YRDGTRFGIRADADGLLRAGEPGVQLTWMDAKVGDLVVTPRIGKPVEVQALWLNALRIAGPDFADLLRRASASFAAKFWNEAAGCLFDVIDATTRRTLADIAPEMLPAILLLKARDACVLLGQNVDGTLQILRPAQASDPVRITRAALQEAYDGHALFLQAQVEGDAEQAQASDDRHWLWGALRQHWPEYAQVILASVLINLLALAVPLFTMNVYDRVFPNAALITLWSLVAGVGLALGFDALLKLLRASVIDRVGRKVDRGISASVFRHVANLRLDNALPPSGSLMNTLKDYEQVADFFSSQTLSHLIDLAFAVLFIALIGYIGGPLAWPPLAALIFVLILGLVILRPLRGASEKNRATGGAKTSVAAEAVGEIETLKAIAGQGRMQARWEGQSRAAALAQAQSRQSRHARHHADGAGNAGLLDRDRGHRRLSGAGGSDHHGRGDRRHDPLGSRTRPDGRPDRALRARQFRALDPALGRGADATPVRCRATRPDDQRDRT
ncbi:MAG: hypothetical protein HC814_04025, partial [Rhodobacteraceae bacterium]|nr:hypothetical protein [Paracoccaceae bacterium]